MLGRYPVLKWNDRLLFCSLYNSFLYHIVMHQQINPISIHFEPNVLRFVDLPGSIAKDINTLLRLTTHPIDILMRILRIIPIFTTEFNWRREPGSSNELLQERNDTQFFSRPIAETFIVDKLTSNLNCYLEIIVFLVLKRKS